MPASIHIMACVEHTQVIIWTDDGPVYWRMIASLGLDESNGESVNAISLPASSKFDVKASICALLTTFSMSASTVDVD